MQRAELKKSLYCLKWGVLSSSFFIFGCSENSAVKEQCDAFAMEQAVNFEQADLAIRDSLVFELGDEFGAINPNIPPKKTAESLFLLTRNNYLLKFDILKGGACKVVGRLPPVYPVISDYLVVNDSILLFCSNNGENSIAKLNMNNLHYTEKFMKDTVSSNSMPFLGLCLQKSAGKYIFPQVAIKDVKAKSNFLGVYNENLDYLYGMGNFSTYSDSHFAPYFDSPVMSEIVDGIFYVTSSSSNGALKCSISGSGSKLSLSPIAGICFSKQLFNSLQGKIAKRDLGDFRKLENAYISDHYTVGLHVYKDNLIRITKGSQPAIHPGTRQKNVAMNAPWTLEMYNFSTGKGTITKVAARLFNFTNTLITNDHFYVLSNSQDQNKLVYYALY